MSEPEIGACLAAFADRSFDDAIDAVARLGLSVIDLPTDSVFALSATRPPPVEAAKRLADAGLRVACVSNSRDAQLVLGPHSELTDPVVAGSAAAKADHGRRAALEAIELAAALGAPRVRLMLGCPDFGRWLRWSGRAGDRPADRPDEWSDNVAAFVAEALPLARRAEAVGVRLCLEPHVKQVVFDAGSWLACAAAMAQAGHPPGLCLDPANLAALGFDPVEFLVATAAVPECVHAKDVERSTSALTPTGPGWVRYGPQPAIRFRSVPWGQLDWPGLLSHLQGVGFAGPILIEHEDVLIERRRGLAGARAYLEAHRLGEPASTRWW